MDTTYKKEITDLLNTYFQANKVLNAEKLITTWHKNSKIFSVEKIYEKEA